MKRIHERNDQCCGCEACANICVHGAIHMERDNEGFYYPSVDKAKCVNCHRCEEVCPTLNLQNIDVMERFSGGGVLRR